MVPRLSVLFLFLFATASFAQTVTENPDSLLLEGDIIKLQEVLSNESASKAASYQGIIAAVKEVTKLDNKGLLIQQAKSYTNNYREAFAGIWASKAFMKFKSSA
ncbi:MAG: hypothetical protein ACM3Q2_17010, partial [Syntrophothermus sp.]